MHTFLFVETYACPYSIRRVPITEKDKVKILTGIVFSNVAMAVVPKEVVYLSANAAPSKLAGEGCHENYFSVSYQNDNLDEVVGQYVTEEGFKSVYLLPPNYPAGADLSDLKAFKAALRQASFPSVRGNFSFGANQHPVQDQYIREVVERNGVFTNKTVKKNLQPCGCLCIRIQDVKKG